MLLDPLQSRDLLAHALHNRYAVLAANADSPAAIGDCLEAALHCDAPIIIETSLWQLEGASFGRGDPVLGLARYLADLAVLAGSPRFARIPVILHTDHIKGPKLRPTLAAAIEGIPVTLAGGCSHLTASTLSVDASDLSAETNIETLKWLASRAEASHRPVTFEMEDAVDDDYTSLDTANRLVGGVESAHPGTIHLWAPALGTHHGLTQGGRAFDPDLAHRHVENLRRLTGRDIGLALHGTSGLDEKSLLRGVQAGVIKVNWSSELLHLRAQAGLDYFTTRVASVQPGHGAWKETVMDNGLQRHLGAACLPAITARIRLLGAENQAGRFLESVSR